MKFAVSVPSTLECVVFLVSVEPNQMKKWVRIFR